MINLGNPALTWAEGAGGSIIGAAGAAEHACGGAYSPLTGLLDAQYSASAREQQAASAQRAVSYNQASYVNRISGAVKFVAPFKPEPTEVKFKDVNPYKKIGVPVHRFARVTRYT